MPKRGVLGIAAGVVCLAIGGWKYMRSIAPRWLETVQLRVGVPSLPPVWEGVRIAHLTDLHVGGAGVRLDMLWRARRIAEAFAPDIIAITGDFYDHGRPVSDGGLLAGWPAASAVVGVLGNHDLRG
ncbi:MAG TPA: metallophosphoesterase, partial [Thermomicrobiales bacterium]|nr:metallophosphoesterase [Thermomicrobiales bacterium]